MTHHRTRAAGALLALALLAAGPPALAGKTAVGAPDILWDFNAPPAPGDFLADVLILGSEGAWTGAVEGGRYHLVNAAAAGTLKYFHVGLTRGGKTIDLSDASVEVDIEGDFADGDSGAGIVYRCDPANGTYLAFLVTAEGYAIWTSDGGGLNRAVSGSLASGPASGPVHLTVRTAADGKAEFLVGDEVVAAISSGAIHGAQVGFAALSVGDYSFDNFATIQAGRIVEEDPAAAAEPEAAQPDAAQPDVAEPDTAQPEAVAPEAATPDAASTAEPAPATQYFIAENNKPVGPLTLDEVAARVAAGTVGPDTLVWFAGTPDWVAASTVPALAQVLGD